MAAFVYRSSMQGVSDFRFPSMQEFVEDTNKRLQEPLVIPEYAVAGEAQPALEVSDAIRAKPYQLRSDVHEVIKNQEQRFQSGTLRPVPYGEYPELYRAAQFTMEVASQFANLDVLIQIYREKSLGDKFQALAVSYLDKGWLFISERFFMHPNIGMLQDSEVCFLLGHELGHAQCRHTSIKLLTKQDPGSNAEYSADRAGLIVCAKWLLRQEPEGDTDALIDRAVLCGIATLKKIDLAYHGFFEWKKFDYDELASQLKTWRSAPKKLAADGATHPVDERRGLAMYYFSQSEMFRRLLGLKSRPGLLTDELLQDLMNTLLK